MVARCLSPKFYVAFHFMKIAKNDRFVHGAKVDNSVGCIADRIADEREIEQTKPFPQQYSDFDVCAGSNVSVRFAWIKLRSKVFQHFAPL